MKSASSTDIDRILNYLRPNVEHCIYLYIDIAKYGVDNPNMQIWFDEKDDKVNLVVMKYHTSISFFTDEINWNADEVIQLIKKTKVNSITAKKDLIEYIYEQLSDTYAVEYGYCFRFTNLREFESDIEAEIPTDEELVESAHLVASDSGIGSYYNPVDLANQFINRRSDGFGRNYVLKKDGAIIGHIASYAEFEDIATTGGLIISPDYRDQLYGLYLERYLLKKLKEDGYRVYTFVTNRKRYKLLSMMGNRVVSEYGKMKLMTL